MEYKSANPWRTTTKRTKVAAVSVAGAVLPWLVVAAAVPGPATAACETPPQFNKSARWWKNVSCGGLNFLSNSNTNSLPNDFNDTFSSVEVGNRVSMAYGYRNGGRSGCRKDIHGATSLSSLGYFSTCSGTSANDEISSVKVVLG